MARIVLADDGIAFDGRTLATRPLGGAETAVVELTEALAARGHEVSVHNRCERPIVHNGVAWRPIGEGVPESCDLFIANRGDKLLRLARKARRTVFWIHNPAGYLLKWRYQWKLVRRRPTIVFSGDHHARTYPRWAFGGPRTVIPYGTSDLFLHAPDRRQAPPPRALFTSNPMRSLDWLLDVWAERIRPRVPDAELHIFAGTAVYGAFGDAKAARIAPILDAAQALGDKGVVLRGPVTKDELAAEWARARACLYRGDVGETFCMAVAEAQAIGVPAVVEDIACMAERVADGKTGFVTRGAEAFADAAVRLLTDDTLWLDQHRAALAGRGSMGWPQAAAEWEKLLP